MLPDIISKIKSEVTQDILDKSRASQFKIEEKKIELPQIEKVLHRWVNCDGCGKRGI